MTDLINATETFTRTVWYDGARADVYNGIEKLNKLVRRHGGEVRIVHVEGVQKRHPWHPTKNIYGETYTITAPSIAGEAAKLVGVFEFAEDEQNVYRNCAPGYTSADMEPFAHRWQDCDHCKTRRARHSSFVVERATGERILVGRQCSRAFIGISFLDLVARLGVAQALRDDSEDNEYFGGVAKHRIFVRPLLDDCYKVALHFGGYSSFLKEDLIRALGVVRTPKDSLKYVADIKLRGEIDDQNYPPLDTDAFARYLDDAKPSDFITNLRVALNCEYVDPKRLPLILAGVGTFVGRALKQRDEAAKNAARAPACLVRGKEGERVSFRAKCIRTAPYQNDFGGGIICVFRAEDGQNAIWFASGSNTPDAGKTYDIKGTIKRHGKDKRTDEPQSVLGRCVCVEKR